MTRKTVYHPTDHRQDYQVLSFERADRHDWRDYQLILSLADNGGYYKYGERLARPKNLSSFTVKSLGGIELCAQGNVRKDHKWTAYPADKTEYARCVVN